MARRGRKRTDAWHLNRMAEYYCWRQAYVLQREHVTRGHKTEMAEYDAVHNVPTFGKFLEGQGQERWELAA